MQYTIRWKVLRNDENGDGVTWVKIGIANKYVDEITKVEGSDIKKAYYYTENTKTFVRCNFSKEYSPGEVIDIRFNIHQKRMFTFMKDPDNPNVELTTYAFKPGWFEDIEVEKIKIMWNKNSVYYCDTDIVEGNYYVWERHLAQGDKTTVQVSYETSSFPNINRKETYKGNKDFSDIKKFAIIIAVILIIQIIIFYIARLFTKPSYYSTRGFYPSRRRFYYRPFYYGIDREGLRKTNPYVSSSSGSGHSSGHSCACACACACAGGGRAGCSKKDFYKGKIDINEFLK